MTCQSKSKAMSDCMDQYYSEVSFKKFLVREQIDLEVKPKKSIFQSAYEVLVPESRR
jgi:hypothetical protein